MSGQIFIHYAYGQWLTVVINILLLLPSDRMFLSRPGPFRAGEEGEARSRGEGSGTRKRLIALTGVRHL
jgi:hypothetical protein